MCMDKVTETYESPSTLIVDGWKLFGGAHDKPTFDQFAFKGSRTVPLDQWIQASDEHAKEIRASDGKKYASGFHAYSDEKDLKKRTGFRRVFLRKITSLGMQGSMKTAIAQEMYVPSDENGWPPKASGGLKSLIKGNA